MFCPNCGKEMIEGEAFCRYCGSRMVHDAEQADDARERTGTPWEEREASGVLPALFRTLRNALFEPSVFFKQMPVTGGLSDPLLYAMIIGMAGIIIHSFWSVLLYNPMQYFFPAEVRTAAGHNAGQVSSIAAIFAPFLLIIWLFVVTGLLHVILMMVHGARAGFEATFRVVSYSVSPFVCLAVPMCGMPLTVLWASVLSIIGLKEAHGISGGKAAFAVLFPLIFCCGLVLASIALIMGAMVASFGSLMHLYQ